MSLPASLTAEPLDWFVIDLRKVEWVLLDFEGFLDVDATETWESVPTE